MDGVLGDQLGEVLEALAEVLVMGGQLLLFLLEGEDRGGEQLLEGLLDVLDVQFEGLDAPLVCVFLKLGGGWVVGFSGGGLCVWGWGLFVLYK